MRSHTVFARLSSISERSIASSEVADSADLLPDRCFCTAGLIGLAFIHERLRPGRLPSMAGWRWQARSSTGFSLFRASGSRCPALHAENVKGFVSRSGLPFSASKVAKEVHQEVHPPF